MKKIIIIIIVFLLIPFTIYIINDIKDKDVFPEGDFTTIETDSSFIDLNNNSFNDLFSTNLLYPPLDTPIIDLDNHTLKEVFEDSTTPTLENLVENGDFSDGTTGFFTHGGGSISVSIGELTHTTTTTNAQRFGQNISIVNANVYYIKIGKLVHNVPILSLTTRSNNLENNIQPITSLANFTNNTNLTYSFIASADAGAVGINIVPDTLGQYVLVDNLQLFNLTDLYGVTETSDTEYDNAVAEIEWFLSINNGYLQNQVNWFEIVDLTVEEMDYYYTLYNSLKNNLSLPNEISYNIYTNDDVIIDLSSLISNNQYSPMYNTTFDLMTTEQIKLQMDEFIEKLYLFIDYESFGISSITTVQMDMYYSYYLNGFDNVTFGNTVSGYTNLQSLMSQNADLNYKLYIKDLSTDIENIQNRQYKLIQNDDNILVSDINDEYLMTIYDDNTYISNISIDNLEFTFEGYNSIGTISGTIPTIAQPFLLIIPLFLIVGFIFLVLKEE